MTDENEQQEPAAGGNADANGDGPASSDAEPLPSVIVDPVLMREHRDAQAAERAPNGESVAAAATSRTSAPPQASVVAHVDERADAPEHAELSADAAERFAASIRPSWEPEPNPHTAAAAGSEAPASPAPSAATAATAERAVVPAGAQDDDIRGLPGSDRKRGLLITGATVLGFATLAALAFTNASAPAAKPSAIAKTAAQSTGAAPASAAPAQPATPAAAPMPATAPSLAAPAQDLQAQVADDAVASAADSADPAPTAEPVEALHPAEEPVGAHEKDAQATVRVHVSARPAQASLTLDNEPIPNPFEADMVKGGKHRVQAHAAGHESADVTIALDRDRELALRLPRKRAPRPASVSHEPSRKRRPSAAARQTAPKSERPSPPRRTQPTPSTPSDSRGAGFVTESPY